MSSAAGTVSGDTAITVDETPGVGNGYVYKLGSAAVVVDYGDDVSDWTAWDGTSEITATTGQIITVVEATSDDEAVAVGSCEVESLPFIGTLTVASAAGTTPGDTVITVTEALEDGDIYKYKVADSATSVTYDQNVQNWSAWDGTAEITAATGKILTLVEATADYKARKVGDVEVIAAE